MKWLYYVNEISQILNLEKEKQMNDLGVISAAQWVRMVVTIICLAITVNVVRAGKWYNLIFFGTNWALLATLGTAFSGCYLMLDDSHHYRALFHFFYTLMIFINPVVILIYWPFERQNHLKMLEEQYSKDPVQHQRALKHGNIVHTVPGLCMVALMVTSDAVLLRRHYKEMTIVCLVYIATNYFYAKAMGKPLYKMLTWDDYKSFGLAACVPAIFIPIFCIIVLVDE